MIVRRLKIATGILFVWAVLSTHLTVNAAPQAGPRSALPPTDATVQTPSNSNPSPPSQNTPPQTRRPGTAATGNSSPDFLRGLQLADSGSRRGRQSHQSLLAPAQFHGSFFGSSGLVTARAKDGQVGQLSADIPAAGGNARFNIADNNKGLPQNRVFFDYRHFNNAIGSVVANPGQPLFVRRQNFDNFLFGIEKTLDEEGLVSIETRLPFSGNADVNKPGYSVEGGELGNIPFTWKQALFMEDSYSFVVGSTLVAPTGGDVTGQIFGSPFSVQNNAWHIAPFFGGMLTPQLANSGNEFTSFLPDATPLLNRTTFQYFGSVDFGLNDQGVVLPGALPGGFREPMLMFLSSAVVVNLFDGAEARNLTRLDGSVELHYAKNIGGGSSFVAGPQGLLFSQSRVTELVNLTAGLSAEIRRNTRIQVAAVAPLSPSDSLTHRAFDSELIFSINRFF